MDTAKRTPQPRVLMTDDGRHASYLYQFEPPVEPADVTFNLDQLVDSGIDTLSYGVCLEGGVVTYDSKVAPRWGYNVECWTHSVWYRAARNLQQLIDDGHDPLELMIARSHAKGLWFFASSFVNFQGGERASDGGLGRKSDFVYDHPEFQIGPEEDPRASSCDPKRFSFLHDQVRQQRHAVFAELLERYATDGIDLDLADHVPMCRFEQAAELAPLMTGWLRSLREVADAAQAAQGRRKRILVRIPAHRQAWAMLGYEVETWVAEGIVDCILCMPGLVNGTVETNLDLTAAVAAAEGADCIVLAGFAQMLGRQYAQYATPEMLWAAAANGYAQGAAGFAIADACTLPNGWPWTDVEYGAWRLLAHPEILACTDKHYRVRSGGGRPPPAWLPGGAPDLPRELREGVPERFEIRIADELERWQRAGRVEAVVLEVHIAAIEASLNEVRIALNGRLLPADLLSLNDLGYRLIRGGAVGPYGFVYGYELTPDYYPEVGRNTIEITLVRRDPNISLPFAVHDIDCQVRYRRHRNFVRTPTGRR